MLNEKKDLEKLEDFKECFRLYHNPQNDSYMNTIIDGIFLNLKKCYYEFKDEIPYVSVNEEPDSLNILPPENNRYSLMDFLINRIFKKVNKIEPVQQGNAYITPHQILQIDQNRYKKYYERYNKDRKREYSDKFLGMQKIKSIMHESGHALEQNYVDKNHYLELKKRLLICKNHLKGKYRLVNENEIRNNTKYEPKENASYEEPFNEMYAALFCGAYDYYANNSESINEKKSSINTYYNERYCRAIANIFNGYTCSIHYIPIRSLVSKKSLFKTKFYLKNDVIKEFGEKYKNEIIKNYKLFQQKIKNENLYNKVLKFAREMHEPDEIISGMTFLHFETEDINVKFEAELFFTKTMCECLKKGLINAKTKEEKNKIINAISIYINNSLYIIDKKSNKLIESEDINDLYKFIQKYADEEKKKSNKKKKPIYYNTDDHKYYLEWTCENEYTEKVDLDIYQPITVNYSLINTLIPNNNPQRR